MPTFAYSGLHAIGDKSFAYRKGDFFLQPRPPGEYSGPVSTGLFFARHTHGADAIGSSEAGAVCQPRGSAVWTSDHAAYRTVMALGTAPPLRCDRSVPSVNRPAIIPTWLQQPPASPSNAPESESRSVAACAASDPPPLAGARVAGDDVVEGAASAWSFFQQRSCLVSERLFGRIGEWLATVGWGKFTLVAILMMAAVGIASTIMYNEATSGCGRSQEARRKRQSRYQGRP